MIERRIRETVYEAGASGFEPGDVALLRREAVVRRITYLQDEDQDRPSPVERLMQWIAAICLAIIAALAVLGS